MPMRLRWLSEQAIHSFRVRWAAMAEATKRNPIMGCSQHRSCVFYDKPLNEIKSECDQYYGIKKCILYYGCRYAHMSSTRQHAALSRRRLNCLRGGRFYVKEVINDED